MLIYQGVIHPCGDSEEVPLADHIQPSFPEGRVKVTRFTQMHTALYTSKQNNLHSTLSNPGVGFGLVLCSPPKMGVNTYQDDLLSNQNGSKLMASNGFPSNITNKTITEKKHDF